MTITPRLFEAYLRCPTKCWLRSTGETASGNVYAEWVHSQDEGARVEGINRVNANALDGEVTAAPPPESMKTATWRWATDVIARAENIEARIPVVERVPSQGRGKAALFVPVLFVWRNKLHRDDKLLLAFDALALAEAVGREVPTGKIVHGVCHTALTVKLSALLGETRKLLERATELLVSPAPPELVLNRHCSECEFQARCRAIAVEKDNLSLLGGMSEKERQKLRKKGIFTSTQLSFIFRPRRRPRRQGEKREKYHHALKALSIREKKIHVVGSPELKIDGTPVYLDVEGLPDRDFYYLIGMRIGNGVCAVHHGLWADTTADEEKIWRQFLGILRAVEKPVLIHYGSYETNFLKGMMRRYGGPMEESVEANVLGSAVNLLSVTYARIYFPSYSNGLKDVAGWMGFRWTEVGASGALAVCWRGQWERTKSPEIKRRLADYNREDCVALELVTTSVSGLALESTTRPDVVLADRYGSKPVSTGRGDELHRTLNQVLKSAHANYSRHKISFSDVAEEGDDSTEIPPKFRRFYRSMPARGGRIINVPRKRKCPNHPDNPTWLRPTKREVRRTLIDVAFTDAGCRKVFVHFLGRKAQCPVCGARCLPPAIQPICSGRLFGEGVCAWVVYLRVALRLSYRLIANAALSLLGEEISPQTSMGLVEQTAQKFAATEKSLLRELLVSPVIHIDETRLNINGDQQYVWVLTDGSHVIFRLTEGRETDFLHKLLKGYSGTIVSDFYGGYDALPCRQQKCWAHLIRDLNEDLWKRPFDQEYECFVGCVRDLLLPILKTSVGLGLRPCT